MAEYHKLPQRRWRTHANIQSREIIGQENHVTCLKLRPHLNFVLRFFGADSKTRIFYKYVVFKHSFLFFPLSIAALTHSLQCDSLIHQQTTNATKWINYANLFFPKILCLWDFFQPRKHQMFQTTGRNEHLKIYSQHE